jgi:predicted AlkP superfamily phosphohydrolase/phosphomutase/Flp pilus assembly protein TadD
MKKKASENPLLLSALAVVVTIGILPGVGCGSGPEESLGPTGANKPTDSVAPLDPRQEEAQKRIRELAQETDARILIVGLDGADWQIAEPLIEQGRLPNLDSLRRRGSWGNIKALLPILSPLIWTSVATGVGADRHGVLDFLVLDEQTGQQVPVDSRYRKVRALWNIFTEADRTVDFVAWWASWPAEEVNGHLVSDRVSYSLKDLSLATGSAGMTHPPGYLDEVRDRLVDDGAITYEEISRFVEVSREEFLAERKWIEQDRTAAYERPLNHLTKILAATRSYHAIALDLLGRGQADLTAVYYQGIDEVGHRFMHFAPPRQAWVSEADFRRYGKVVEEFYVWQDELLGELLRAADPDTTVIVLSDHGFINGPDRPEGETADIEGQPSRWHRLYGLIAMAGPQIESRRLDTVSMLDITPTVLRLAGLPVAEDMDGRVIEEAIRPEFRERFPQTKIATYDSTPLRPDTVPMSESMDAVTADVLENLRALGYIGDGAGAESAVTGVEGAAPPSGTVVAHANLAGVLLLDGKLEEAEAEILAGLNLKPSFVPLRRHLFTLREQQGRLDEAIEVAVRLIVDGETKDSQFLTRVARAYDGAGRTSDGIRFFRSAVQQGRWELGAPLSHLLMVSGDLPGAELEARTVLERDPLDEGAMATLVGIGPATGNPELARPVLEAAIAANPRSVAHLNWMAVVHASTGDPRGAEDLLLRAMEVDPDHAATNTNLGSLYGRSGRAAEAVPLLQKAVRLDPNNLQARVNLGMALGQLGRTDESLAELEEAVERGFRNAAICNLLAGTYGQRGDHATAAKWLRLSLEIDPNQPMTRQLLEQIENR